MGATPELMPPNTYWPAEVVFASVTIALQRVVAKRLQVERRGRALRCGQLLEHVVSGAMNGIQRGRGERDVGRHERVGGRQGLQEIVLRLERQLVSGLLAELQAEIGELPGRRLRFRACVNWVCVWCDRRQHDGPEISCGDGRLVMALCRLQERREHGVHGRQQFGRCRIGILDVEHVGHFGVEIDAGGVGERGGGLRVSELW